MLWDGDILPDMDMSCSSVISSWSTADIVAPIGIAWDASVRGISNINAVTKTKRRAWVTTLIHRLCLMVAN